MTARLIDGKGEAARLVAQVADRVASLVDAGGRAPVLAVVLVGEDPASRVYVRTKLRQTEAAGIGSVEHRLAASTDPAELLALVARLNDDDGIDGILVQLPLPTQIDGRAVLSALDPAKDVDGFHPLNVGRLATGQDGLVPCTPLGCVRLLNAAGVTLPGAHAVIVGRSNIVGRPLAQLLLREDCTVTVAHSHTRDLARLCRDADILIAATGRAGMIDAGFIRPGAVVVDVGINRDAAGRLVGDVDFASVSRVASAITPVPGGVGPMTVACLLYNTVKAHMARCQSGR